MPPEGEAAGELVRFPSERVEARVRFDAFFDEEHDRLYKALYLVTGNRRSGDVLFLFTVQPSARRG